MNIINKRGIIYITIILILLLSFGCNNKYSIDELKSKAIEKTAKELGVEPSNITIRIWAEVGEFEGYTSFIASFYKSGDNERHDYLGLFEFTPKGSFNMISFNANILNSRDNSTDKSRIYEIAPDGKYTNGFCLSNGESWYYFVIRPQEDAREILFCLAFMRKLCDNGNICVAEYKNTEYQSITFQEFSNRQMLPSSGSEFDKEIVHMPDILNNGQDLFLISSDYKSDKFSGEIEHYQEGQKKEVMKLTKIKLMETSYRNIELKLKATDGLGKEKEILISFKSSVNDSEVQIKYPVNMTIYDKEQQNTVYALSGEPDDRWNKSDAEERITNIIISYYLPADAKIINVFPTDINNDGYYDYLVTAVYGADKEKQSGIFTFTGNQNYKPDFIGMENLGQMLIDPDNDKHNNIIVDWSKSIHPQGDGYILTIARKETSFSENFYVQFNSKNKMYISGHWTVNYRPGSTMEIIGEDYSQAYVFSDFIKNKPTLNIGYKYADKVTIDNSGEWFIKTMLSDEYSEEMKRTIMQSLYIPEFNINIGKECFEVVDLLYQWDCIDEAYRLFGHMEYNSDIWEDYTISYYWAARFAYLYKSYDYAFDCIETYINQCKKNDIPIKEDTFTLKEQIENTL